MYILENLKQILTIILQTCAHEMSLERHIYISESRLFLVEYGA